MSDPVYTVIEHEGESYIARYHETMATWRINELNIEAPQLAKVREKLRAEFNASRAIVRDQQAFAIGWTDATPVTMRRAEAGGTEVWIERQVRNSNRPERSRKKAVELCPVNEHNNAIRLQIDAIERDIQKLQNRRSELMRQFMRYTPEQILALTAKANSEEGGQ